ncbi:hypothetical protein MC378_10490 [Polaribacter sp. MSW13]|uniref:Uncharacterized protein n=1 Tax=Polaribacter marinus TaxID=2916838 RepID=A0A9X1VNW6_9FLAO|nr:hypothetical protein [Polaribacter marinus]MCI2229596.1 hypothetical protein [Polaribacter marinus]
MSYIQDYINKMVAEKEANTALENITSESKVSIWRNFIYVVSFIANFVKELQEAHKKEVTALIDSQKHTNLNYYRDVVFNYRDGHTFDSEMLDYTGTYTDDEIAIAKIVKRAASDTVNENGLEKIVLKLATETDGELSKIEEIALERIKEHVRINAPAGTNFSFISTRPDELKLTVNCYIDPQVLDDNGNRIDGTANNVVAEAVEAFFEDTNFKFDGELVLSLLEDQIQAVSGIQDKSVRFTNVQANSDVPAVWTTITERYTSYSGYYKIVELNVNYLIK